jgi:hypothetical protein
LLLTVAASENVDAAQRAVLIERSTVSLGQQSTFSPACFW